MDVTLTPEQEKKLQKAAAINDMQMLMAKYVELMSKMDAAGVFELFDKKNPDASIELAEMGGYDGPDHVKAFLDAYDKYMQDPSDKRGYMDLQTICNPYIKVSADGKKAVGTWSLFAPSSRWAMPYPCDTLKLSAFWHCGKYYVDFVNTDGGWKILKLQMISFLRSEFKTGWMTQADCSQMPVLPGMKPDRESSYYNVYNADYSCASGGIEWGPYLPDEEL